MTLAGAQEQAAEARHLRDYPRGHRGTYCTVAACRDARPDLRGGAAWRANVRARDETGTILVR